MDYSTVTIASLARNFSNESAAWQCMETWRWPNGPVCPHCGTVNNATFLKPRSGQRKTRTGNVSFRRLWKCNECKEQFSVLVGTVFEDSRVPLSKWLLAVHMMCSSKNGVAALELHRTLEVAYRTAWFMCHRIRKAMESGPLHDALMTGTVESDETYIGGHKKGAYRGDMSVMDNKTPVVTLVQRDGEARSQAMEQVTRDNLTMNLVMNVDADAHLMTDENTKYLLAGKLLQTHETVNHSDEEYARGDVHVNTVEGFFSQLKRSLDGTHHQVSRRHLPRYLAEFDFRYNTRKMTDGERTVTAVRKAAGKRLMYDKVVEK